MYNHPAHRDRFCPSSGLGTFTLRSFLSFPLLARIVASVNINEQQ
jgi:hypothetical protein